MAVEGGALKVTALELFEGLATSYERTVEAATLLQDRYWKRWLLEHANLCPRDLVLDIGCGTCLLEERLETTGCSTVGLDLSTPMIRIGQAKRLVSVKLLILGDADWLPFPDSTFDVVVSCYVPKYVDPVRLASEVTRILKPGGRVVLYDFVKPRGILFPFLAIYIQGFLRAAGFLLRMTKNKAAFTFQNLPRIVQGATWDESIAPRFSENGVSQGHLLRLTGGVVVAYAGTKLHGAPGHE